MLGLYNAQNRKTQPKKNEKENSVEHGTNSKVFFSFFFFRLALFWILKRTIHCIQNDGVPSYLSIEHL